MVLIIDKNTEKEHYFPKNCYKFYESFRLKIERGNIVNTIDVEDSHKYQKWYSFEADFSTYSDGEYTYTIYGINEENMEPIGYGLIRIGCSEEEKKAYKEKYEYIEYKG